MWKMKVRFAYEFAKYCTCMKYPIGIQTFDRIREDGYVYVDKTRLIYSMTHEGTVYFLSRPRRFGKSLLLSTLKNYFLGRRELFEGLEISKLEKEWNTYPVFHVDFGLGNYARTDSLDNVLNSYISEWERTYHVPHPAPTHEYSLRFHDVLKAAHAATGLRAVVLIDEYDKPLLDILDSGITLERSGERITLEEYNRELLRTLYTTFKAADEYLQFVMLTGVTKFSQVSVFSGFNQPNDISMDARYETLCGITQAELLTVFDGPIRELAEYQRLSFDETVERLKAQYDGYHFSDRMTDIFNPFSILNCLSKMKMDNYWFASGTPTYLVRLLSHCEENINELVGKYYEAQMFVDYKADMERPLPMIYQSGYLTIKDYNPRRNTYLLDFPNREVRSGFITALASDYFGGGNEGSSNWLQTATDDLEAGRTEPFILRMKSLLASVSHRLLRKGMPFECERHFHAAFYLILQMVGSYTHYIEKETSEGNIDCVVECPDYIYVMEFKLDRSGKEALAQIHTKGYYKPYLSDARPVILVGINFSSATGTIEDYEISLCEKA